MVRAALLAVGSCLLLLDLAAAPLHRRQSVTAGMIAHWPLDTIVAGAPATTPDTAGTFTATLNGTGGGPTTAAGRFGNAFVFDGTSHFLSVADNAALNFGITTDFTVSVWAKPNDLTNKLRVINKWDNAGKGWLLDFNSDAGGGNLAGAIRWRVTDATNNTALIAPAGTLTSTANWVHVAGVADRTNGNLRLYLNGTELTPASPMAIVGNATMTVDTVGISVGMGMIVNGSLNNYNGMMDDVRLYNRALLPVEIAALAAGIDAPPTAVGGFTADGTANVNTGAIQVVLAWTTQGTQVVNYLVQRSPAGAGTFATIATLPPTATGYTDTTAAVLVPYDYRIQSVNPLGTANSTVQTVTPQPPPPKTTSSAGNNDNLGHRCGCSSAGNPGLAILASAAALALLAAGLRRR